MEIKFVCLSILFVIICPILLVGCQNLSKDGPEIKNQPFNKMNSYDILEQMAQTLCGSIKVYGGVPFYNLTGITTCPVKEGAILYMTSVRDLTFDNSLDAVKNCVPVWRMHMNDSNKFMIPDVPPGRYVAWLPSTQFLECQGFMILDEFQNDKNELVVALNGGDSRYSMVVFEILTKNFTDQEIRILHEQLLK